MHRMRARTIFAILLVLILLFTFGPALIAVGSEFVAEAFGCKTDLNYAVPCTIGGKDYGQTFYDLGFLIWYSYLTLPIGAALAAIWAVAALIASLRARRTSEGPAGAPAASPGKSFLRWAAIAILLALSPIAITHVAGFIASRIGCDLNDVAEHPCTLLGMNVGPLLHTLAQSVWFISLTVMAGLVALIVLFIVFIVRVARARRAQVDESRAKA
jgi:TRAP-type C4-dicarboxylate transport system permease small subunit